MATRPAKSHSYVLGQIITYFLVLMLVFAVVAPFAWMILSSISPQTELSAVPPHWIPEQPTLDRYKALYFQGAGSNGKRFYRLAWKNSFMDSPTRWRSVL